jgi:hypothetical protein
MKKIINKSKLIFYAGLIFVFNVNISSASEFKEWGVAQNETRIMSNNEKMFNLISSC